MDNSNNMSKSQQPFTIHKSFRGKQEAEFQKELGNFDTNVQLSEPALQQQPVYNNTSQVKPKKKEEKLQEKNFSQQIQLINNNNMLFNTDQEKDQGMQVSQEQKNLKLQKDYDAKYTQYINEDYTHQANYFLNQISKIQQHNQVANIYPLYKLLRAVAKKFFFNELEILIYAYILSQNEWQYKVSIIEQNADQLQDFLNLQEVHNLHDYKCLLLYLILNGYAVKFYINQQSEMDIIEHHLNQICPNFSQAFTSWSKLYATQSLKINPKQLNIIFKQLSQKPCNQQKKQNEDYNALVDQIMQISPPYNNEKNQSNQNDQNSAAQNNTQVLISKSKIQQNNNSNFSIAGSQLIVNQNNQQLSFQEKIVQNTAQSTSAFSRANLNSQQSKIQKNNISSIISNQAKSSNNIKNSLAQNIQSTNISINNLTTNNSIIGNASTNINLTNNTNNNTNNNNNNNNNPQSSALNNPINTNTNQVGNTNNNASTNLLFSNNMKLFSSNLLQNGNVNNNANNNVNNNNNNNTTNQEEQLENLNLPQLMQQPSTGSIFDLGHNNNLNQHATQQQQLINLSLLQFNDLGALNNDIPFSNMLSLSRYQSINKNEMPQLELNINDDPTNLQLQLKNQQSNLLSNQLFPNNRTNN